MASLDANLGSVASDTSGTTHVLTTDAAAASSSLIVVAISAFSNFAGGIASVAGGGLTWTVDHVAGPYLATAIATAPAPSGLASGTQITVTLDAAMAPCMIAAASFTGVNTGSSRKVSWDGANADGAAAWNTPALSLAVGDLLVAACMGSGGGVGTNTPGGGLTELEDFAGAGQDYFTFGYLIADATSETPSGTWSNTPDTWQSIAVAYLNGGGGGGGSAPVNTASPVASGTTVLGQTLSVTTGTWSNSPTAYAYQWQRDASGSGGYTNIPSATANTYVLVAADVGCNVRCIVTASNASGSTQANSNSLGLVTGAATYNITLETARAVVCGSITSIYSIGSGYTVAVATAILEAGGSVTVVYDHTPVPPDPEDPPPDPPPPTSPQSGPQYPGLRNLRRYRQRRIWI